VYALPLAACAQNLPLPPLTEAQEVHRGLARDALADLERGAIDAAQADILAAGLAPNPILGYGRERIPGTPNGVEETWQISQAFDLSGRRGLRLDAAGRIKEAAASGNLARRVEIAAEIRRRFHELLLKQEIVRASELWLQRFIRIEATVDKLARGGEASGYDRRRLARERQTAEARLATELAELERSRERLAALLGNTRAFVENSSAWNNSAGNVAGSLLPEALPLPEAALAGLELRPDLQALARRAEAADLEGRAAARGWVPEVTLGIGVKQSDNGSARENGALLAVSIPLPLFDRQQAREKRATAEALATRAEYRLARARAEGELRGLYAQGERLRQAAVEFRAATVKAAPELLRIAEAAYRGGESTLLELLDAYRGALEAETTALLLEWKARETRIEYDQLTGRISE